MKKLLLVLGLVVMMVALLGCPKKPPPPVEQPPVTAVDTTPPPPPPPPPPQPSAPPVVKETDFVVVYFDFDKYNVRADQVANVEQNAAVMNKYPNTVIKIEGHCDERGTVEYNLALGDKRANAVKDYLIRLGISADRIETISYGKERPVDPDHNDAAWDKNRRAEFRVLSQ